MELVILIIHLLLALALIGVVLIQRSEGGALGIGGGSSGGGMSGFLTGRTTANLLTRTTAIIAALFIATSMALAMLAGASRSPAGVVTGEGAGPTTQQSGAPSGQGSGPKKSETGKSGTPVVPEK